MRKRGASGCRCLRGKPAHKTESGRNASPWLCKRGKRRQGKRNVLPTRSFPREKAVRFEDTKREMAPIVSKVLAGRGEADKGQSLGAAHRNASYHFGAEMGRSGSKEGKTVIKIRYQTVES